MPEFARASVPVDAAGSSFAVTGLGRELTIKRPLTRTAGFAYGVFDDSPVDGTYQEPRLVSTAADYLRFAQMLVNRGELESTRLLGRRAVELMTTNHLADKLIPIRLLPHTLQGKGFGLGFGVTEDTAQACLLTSEGEHGWGRAASTSFFVDPKEDLIGLLPTQVMPSRTFPIRSQFKVLVGQALVD